MKRLFLSALLLLMIFLTACHKKSEQLRYTSVLEGIKTVVSTQTGGTIVSLLVSEGDEVSMGDTIAVLDDRELSYQMEQINSGKHELDVQDGVYRTQIAQIETDLEYIRQRRSRTQNLYNAEVISRQNLDDIINQESKVQAQLDATTKSLDLLSAKREQLASQEKTLLKRRGDMVIRANSSGRIDIAFYKQGEIVPPLGQILQIINTDKLTARIYVSEAELSRVKIGSPVHITSTGQGHKATGSITHIANKAEFTPKAILTPDNRSSMVYAVEVTINDHDGYLKDGMPVDISLD